MIAEAFVALEGLKQVFGLAQGGIAANTQQQINQAIIDIQRALLDTQAAAFEDKQIHAKLVAQIAELNQTLGAYQNWNAVKARYVLTKSDVGTFTRELRPEFANEETHHSLCVNCFENGRKSILHGTRISECQACGKRLRVRSDPPIHNSRREDW